MTTNGCSGDGTGEPSTCQIHMAPWYRAKSRCEGADTARQRFLQFLMDELDAYDWNQSGSLDPYLAHADAIEAEAREIGWLAGITEGRDAERARATPPALDVEQLNTAMWNILRRQDRGSSIFPEDARAIAAEYARLTTEGEQT